MRFQFQLSFTFTFVSKRGYLVRTRDRTYVPPTGVHTAPHWYVPPPVRTGGRWYVPPPLVRTVGRWYVPMAVQTAPRYVPSSGGTYRPPPWYVPPPGVVRTGGAVCTALGWYIRAIGTYRIGRYVPGDGTYRPRAVCTRYPLFETYDAMCYVQRAVLLRMFTIYRQATSATTQ